MLPYLLSATAATLAMLTSSAHGQNTTNGLGANVCGVEGKDPCKGANSCASPPLVLRSGLECKRYLLVPHFLQFHFLQG
jgi:hypothetical protein